MGKQISGIAFAVALGLGAPVYMASPALAQAVDAAALTQCLIDNTTDDHIAAMKRLMIAALNDDTAALQAEATNYGNIIVQMAIANCHIEASQLTDPAVNEAVGAYGQKLGEKIMTDAFAKMGQ